MFLVMKMVRHIVMWRLKEKNKHENSLLMKKMIEDLKKHIDVIFRIEVTIFEDKNNPYDVLLYSEFASMDNLKRYIGHPKHLEVGAFVSQVREERVAFDYENNT